MRLSEQPATVENLFKRQDIFRCRHQSHARFSYVVSVHHVLEEKGCWPEGCLYFRWHCRRMDRKERCIKKYSRPGRECGGCQHFYDEKEHYRPEVRLAPREWDEFQSRYRRFKWWVDEINDGRHSFLGTVAYIKPRLVNVVGRRGSFFRRRGWLACFREGYLGRTHFTDLLYLNLGTGLQEKIRLTPGTEVEMTAVVTVNRGRFVLTQPRSIRCRGGDLFDETPSLESCFPSGGRTFSGQPERCIACERGVLVDVVDGERREAHLGRELLCLEGYASARECTYGAMKAIKLERCAREPRSA